MKKTLFLGTVITLIALGLFALLSTQRKTSPPSKAISVVTTLFPLYDFARTIGGDKVSVTLILPPGIEPHAYEPKPSDITTINNARVFVYTGSFMEPWAQDIIEGTNKKVQIVDASKGVPLLTSEEHHDEGAADKEEKDHGHSPEGIDPHIWLDFENARIMASNITMALVKVDPKNARYYETNLGDYIKQLTALDTSYKATLASCNSKTIVYGGHYAFGYMAKRYGLTYSAAQGFSPDAEPTVKDMIALVEYVKNNAIRAIFYEELASPKIAQTLSTETQTQLLLLNGAHNLTKEDYASGATFLSLMKKNLDNLKQGLECNQQ